MKTGDDPATYYAQMESAWAGYPSTDDIVAYEAFFAEMGADRTMEELVRELMGQVPRSTRRVLEFGCDNGILLTLFREPGLELAGVDINRDAIARGRVAFPDLDLRVNTGLTVPFEDDHFDVVVASAVLKHIRPEDRPALYEEFRRVGRHLLAVFEESTKVEAFGPFTFYRSDFVHELGEVFEPVQSIRTGGYVFALFRTR
jgi:SAM-dependent methyltransferase